MLCWVRGYIREQPRSCLCPHSADSPQRDMVPTCVHQRLQDIVTDMLSGNRVMVGGDYGLVTLSGGVGGFSEDGTQGRALCR